MKQIYHKDQITSLPLEIKSWDIIFLYGDLAAWKTTLSKHIINNLLKIQNDITSPTYTYYNKYGDNIYHFDLYRLQNYDEFFAIGWEDIMDIDNAIILVEWPELIEKYYIPTKKIFLRKIEGEDDKREIEII